MVIKHILIDYRCNLERIQVAPQCLSYYSLGLGTSIARELISSASSVLGSRVRSDSVTILYALEDYLSDYQHAVRQKIIGLHPSSLRSSEYNKQANHPPPLKK